MEMARRDYPTFHCKNHNSYSLMLHVPEDYEEMVSLIDDNFKQQVESMARNSQQEFGNRVDFLNLRWDPQRGLYDVKIDWNNSGIYLERNIYRFRKITNSAGALNSVNIISRYLNGLETKARLITKVQNLPTVVEGMSSMPNFDIIKPGFSKVPRLEVTT